MNEWNKIFCSKDYWHSEDVFDEYLIGYQKAIKDLRKSFDVSYQASSFLEKMDFWPIEKTGEQDPIKTEIRLFATVKDIFYRRESLDYLNVYTDQERKVYFEYSVCGSPITSEVFILNEPHRTFEALKEQDISIVELCSRLPQLSVKESLVVI